ncbi:glycosyltransferase family 2 protein [Psychrobacter faecalis]
MNFSIVIPLYNKSYSVKRCIDSVLSQSYKNFEIIVVNDGSSDESLSIVENMYAIEINKKLIRIINQNNQGVSIARNNGVAASQSNYICFLDADDEWLPNFLESMAGLINDYPNAALYTLAYNIQKEGFKSVKSKRGLPRNHRGYVEDFFKASAKGNVVHTSTACVLKSVFIELGGFPNNVVAGEDLYLWIMFALNNKVACEESFLTMVHIQKDDSRGSRYNSSVPYPLIYFSENTHLMKNSFLNRYLFTIFYKHFASSILNFRIKEALLRLKYFTKTINFKL